MTTLIVLLRKFAFQRMINITSEKANTFSISVTTLFMYEFDIEFFVLYYDE